jgi:protein-S-isoprenylcysteine O-methyltransferase Ste14
MFFRFRFWIILALYLVGFLAPWQRLLPIGPEVTLWLAASTWIARTVRIDIETSTVAVTLVALLCCCVGAAFRLWGTAFLGSGVMRDGAMHGDQLVASGPYRYLRNPLYLGSFLLAAGVSILMPPGGALVFLAALFLLYLTLIRGEEKFLAARLGEAYLEYRRRVPRLVPQLRSVGSGSGIPASEAQPQWLYAAVAEIWPVGFTLCFAVLAWQYNALILMKCLIVCFGLSLVARATLPRAVRAA